MTLNSSPSSQRPWREVAALLLAGCASAVSATPVNVSVDDRQVLIHDTASGDHFGPQSPQNMVGHFADSISLPLGVPNFLVTTTAVQDTQVPANGPVFNGSGSAQVGFSAAPGTGVFAQSYFDVFFDLLTPHFFNLAGFLSTSNDGGLALSQFQLGLDGDLPLIDLEAQDNGPSVSLTSSGLLQPGTYELFILSLVGPDNGGGFYGGNAAFDFTLAFTDASLPVPEPASVTLVAAGLLAACLRRRRAQPH